MDAWKIKREAPKRISAITALWLGGGVSPGTAQSIDLSLSDWSLEVKVTQMDLNQYGNGNTSDAVLEGRLSFDLARARLPNILGQASAIKFSAGIGMRDGHSHVSNAEVTGVSQWGTNFEKDDEIRTEVAPTGLVFGRIEWEEMLTAGDLSVSPYAEIGNKVDVGLGRGYVVKSDTGDVLAETRLADGVYQELGACLSYRRITGCAGYYAGDNTAVYDPTRSHDRVRENGVSGSISVDTETLAEQWNDVFGR